MWKTIFYPNQTNSNIYIAAVFVMFLFFIGSISAIAVLFAYFLETIIIGLFIIIKMLYIIQNSSEYKGSQYGKILFFIVHYGGFVAIQSIFAFSYIESEDLNTISDSFSLIDNYITIFQLENIWILLGLTIFSHAYNLITVFINEKRYLEITASEIMITPYVRIVVQQFVVILAGFFLFWSSSAAAVVILVIIRTFVDCVIISIKENSPLLKWLVENKRPPEITEEEFRRHLKNLTE
jgi:hypothetical protein